MKSAADNNCTSGSISGLKLKKGKIESDEENDQVFAYSGKKKFSRIEVCDDSSTSPEISPIKKSKVESKQQNLPKKFKTNKFFLRRIHNKKIKRLGSTSSEMSNKSDSDVVKNKKCSPKNTWNTFETRKSPLPSKSKKNNRLHVTPEMKAISKRLFEDTDTPSNLKKKKSSNKKHKQNVLLSKFHSHDQKCNNTQSTLILPEQEQIKLNDTDRTILKNSENLTSEENNIRDKNIALDTINSKLNDCEQLLAQKRKRSRNNKYTKDFITDKNFELLHNFREIDDNSNISKKTENVTYKNDSIKLNEASTFVPNDLEHFCQTDQSKVVNIKTENKEMKLGCKLTDEVVPVEISNIDKSKRKRHGNNSKLSKFESLHNHFNNAEESKNTVDKKLNGENSHNNKNLENVTAERSREEFLVKHTVNADSQQDNFNKFKLKRGRRNAAKKQKVEEKLKTKQKMDCNTSVLETISNDNIEAVELEHMNNSYEGYQDLLMIRSYVSIENLNNSEISSIINKKDLNTPEKKKGKEIKSDLNKPIGKNVEEIISDLNKSKENKRKKIKCDLNIPDEKKGEEVKSDLIKSKENEEEEIKNDLNKSSENKGKEMKIDLIKPKEKKDEEIKCDLNEIEEKKGEEINCDLNKSLEKKGEEIKSDINKPKENKKRRRSKTQQNMENQVIYKTRSRSPLKKINFDHPTLEMNPSSIVEVKSSPTEILLQKYSKIFNCNLNPVVYLNILDKECNKPTDDNKNISSKEIDENIKSKISIKDELQTKDFVDVDEHIQTRLSEDDEVKNEEQSSQSDTSAQNILENKLTVFVEDINYSNNNSNIPTSPTKASDCNLAINAEKKRKLKFKIEPKEIERFTSFSDVFYNAKLAVGFLDSPLHAIQSPQKLDTNKLTEIEIPEKLVTENVMKNKTPEKKVIKIKSPIKSQPNSEDNNLSTKVTNVEDINENSKDKIENHECLNKIIKYRNHEEQERTEPLFTDSKNLNNKIEINKSPKKQHTVQKEHNIRNLDSKRSDDLSKGIFHDEHRELSIENTTNIISVNESNDNFDKSNASKPKHVFKFVDQNTLKRPPSRAPSRPILHRDIELFKEPFKYTTKKQPPKNKEKEFDIISIYADTIGPESVCDVASIKNDSDSDNEDLNDFSSLLPLPFDEIKHKNVDKWVENTFNICETQKKSLSEPLNEAAETKTDSTANRSPLREEQRLKPESSHPIKVDEQVKKTDIIKEIPDNKIVTELSETNKNAVNISVPKESSKSSHHEKPYDLFLYLCPRIKSYGKCKVKTCNFKHNFPNSWQLDLKILPVESVIKFYNSIKENRYLYLFKKVFSVIVEYLGMKKDFNSLINMVTDVLKLKIDSDRAPFIDNIIAGLSKTGVTFHSIVELVFKNAIVESKLRNLLADILLNLTVEKNNLNENWSIVKMLVQHRNYDIDIGIIRSILMESLSKDNKELYLKIYQDVIKNISKDHLRSLCGTDLNNFTEKLRKFGLTSEADELLLRCQLLNIQSDHSSLHSSPVPVPISPLKNITKVEALNIDFTPRKNPPNITFVPPPNQIMPNPCMQALYSVPPPPIFCPTIRTPLYNTPPPSLLTLPIIRPSPQAFKNRPSFVNYNKKWYSPQVQQLKQNNIFGPSTSSAGSNIPFTSVCSQNLNANYLSTDLIHVKSAVYEENMTMIFSLINKFKDTHLIDIFIKTCVEAMLETPHNYPTFYHNLCQNAKALNLLSDKSLEYIFKTIGLNLVLYLAQSSKWDQSFLIYKCLMNTCKNDIYNAKIFLSGEQLSYYRRILLIALINVKKGEYETAWKILLENVFSVNNLWQKKIDKSDIPFRDQVTDELLTSLIKTPKKWRLTSHIVFFIIRNKCSNINIGKYLDGIFLQIIDNKCSMDTIKEFIKCSPNWFELINQYTFRSLVVYAMKNEWWSLAKQFYVTGCNLDIYPQLTGTEQTVAFPTHFVLEEMQLMLEIFLQSMESHRPIQHSVIIKIIEKSGSYSENLPNLLKQFHVTVYDTKVRIQNIFSTYIKPALNVTAQQNYLIISPEQLNKHLDCRIQNRWNGLQCN